MRQLIGFLAISFALAVSACSSPAPVSPAKAAGPLEVSCDELGGKIVRTEVSRPLSEAAALSKAGKFDGALVKAREADYVSNKTPYEACIVREALDGINSHLGK